MWINASKQNWTCDGFKITYNFHLNYDKKNENIMSHDQSMYF